MRYDPDKHHRRSIRLAGYDYARTGVYFVTVCTFGRECLFGDVDVEAVRLSQYGRIVEESWSALPRHFPGVALDVFVVMPNHFHGVVLIEADAREHPDVVANRGAHASPRPAPARPQGTQPGSLGAIVQNFKAISTRKINQLRDIRGAPVWQRNYYERVIRDNELNPIRQYILDNPARWDQDKYHPARHPSV